MTPKSLKSLPREWVCVESEELLSEYHMAKFIRMKDLSEKLKSLSTVDPNFWRTAVQLADCKIKALEAETKYWEARQLHNPNDNTVLPTRDLRRWTENITGRMKAASLEKQLYQIQADRTPRWSPLREFVSVATSCLGVATENRQMTRAEYVKFRQSLITAYDAGNLDCIFDSATGTYYPLGRGSGFHQKWELIVAAPIVAHKLGQETITALFSGSLDPFSFQGRTPPDLFSPDNGLLLPRNVALALDYGALAIVPNVDDDAYTNDKAFAIWEDKALAKWENNETREYKWIIIDDTAWEFLNDMMFPQRQPESEWHSVRFLGGKKVYFPPGSNHRPSPQLLYFAFIVSVLKTVWRHGSLAGTVINFEKLEKTIWTRDGLSINQALFVALRRGLIHGKDLNFHNPHRTGIYQQNVEIALLALTRALDIRKTRLDEEATEEWGEEELGDGEDGFDWMSDRFQWKVSNEEAERKLGRTEKVHAPDDDDDEEEEEEGSDDDDDDEEEEEEGSDDDDDEEEEEGSDDDDSSWDFL